MKQEKLLKNHTKFLKKYVRINKKWFAAFILLESFFIICVILFSLNLFFYEKAISWSVCTISAILLFTYVSFNFVNVNSYFKEIIIYKYKFNINKTKIIFSRKISYTPVGYLIWNIFSNFIIASIITYETSMNFAILFAAKNSSSPSFAGVIFALTTAGLNMLLIPSFVNAITTIRDIKKQANSKYALNIKDQYFSHESLFDDVEVNNDYLNVHFNKLDLNCKNGIFIVQSQDDLEWKEFDQIVKINEMILDDYKKIWEKYYEILKTRLKTKFSKKGSYSLKWIERLYDSIFMDFFNFE